MTISFYATLIIIFTDPNIALALGVDKRENTFSNLKEEFDYSKEVTRRD
jgi:hypothetical protein